MENHPTKFLGIARKAETPVDRVFSLFTNNTRLGLFLRLNLHAKLGNYILYSDT
jgi:hypothetical protein